MEFMNMKNYKMLKPLLILFFLIGFVNPTNAQSYKKGFKKLSRAEKCWIVFHPFKANKAYKISKEVSRITDSILKTETLGLHHNGNQLDAFKHAFWMWSLADKIGYKSANSLGKQHEKGNYQFYKKHKLEDGVLPDKISSEMDLINNSVGLLYYKKYKNELISKNKKIELLKQAVLNGEMRMISQTIKREYIDKTGQIIPQEEYYGLWENKKCLVPTRAEYLMVD